MVVLGLLRAALSHGDNVCSFILKRSPTFVRTPNVLVPVRRMGDGPRKMVILPSTFEFTRFKDGLHMAFMAGILPVGAIIFYADVFVGQAELADIPEGYEPMPWEYHRHPIKRFFQRYIHSSPEKVYEKNLHVFWVTREHIKYRRLENKVEHLMSQRGDYKAWYWRPLDDRQLVSGKKYRESKENCQGKTNL